MNFYRFFVNLFQFNRTNWKAVASCFLTAATFWLFTALNKNHITNVRFPLHFEYDEQKYVPSSPLPDEVILNVSGNGWDLFRKHFGLKVPTLTIHLEKPTETKKIPRATLISTLAGQLGNLQTNFAITDTLYLNIDEKYSKKFKLSPDLSDVSYKKGFGRTSRVVVLPDSVELVGPRAIIKKLSDSISLHLDISRVSGNIREQVEVVVPQSEFIKRNPPVAEVMFEAGEVLQLKKWVKLKIGKMTWGTEIERDSIAALFFVPGINKENFQSLRFVAWVDINDIRKGETKKFAPHIIGLPEWAELVRVDSVKVRRY